MSIDFTSALWGGETDPPCLIDSLLASARRHPDRTALVADDLTLTYAELLAWAGGIARDLDEHGSRAGERVGIACPRGAEAVAAMVAVMLSGRAYVPLDLEYPRLRLEHMLRDSGVGVVLHATDVFDLSTTAVAVPVQSPAPVTDIPAESWVGKHEPDLPGYVIYTSGSTGWPKGVVLQHSCLDNVAHWQAGCSPAPDLRTAQFAPLNFDVSFQEIFGTLCGGGTLVVVPESLRRDPVTLLAWLTEHRVQRLFLPYVALQMLAVAATFTPVDDLALVEVNVAGEQLVCTDDIRGFFTGLPDCRLVNHYGQSESAMVSYHVLGRDAARWPALPPIGQPLPGCELLVDLDDTDPAGTGELLVGGLAVSLGYLNQPELNRQRYLDVEPTRYGNTRLFRTGDLVRLEAGGVRFLTRTDDDVKLRGIRVNLAEVEAQLMALPQVASATVVVSEGNGRPRALRAAVVPKEPGQRFDEEDLLSPLRRTLPDVSVPLSVIALDRMPRTPSGKLDRDAVAQLIEAALEN